MLTYERTFGGYVILNKVKNLKTEDTSLRSV